MSAYDEEGLKKLESKAKEYIGKDYSSAWYCTLDGKLDMYST